MKDIMLKTSRLAKLKLSDEKLSEYSDKASKILDYVKKLDEIDTSKIELMSFGSSMPLLREDQPEKFSNRDDIMNNLPEKSGSFVKVPQIIEED